MKQFTISLVNAIKEWAKEWGRQFIMNLVWLVSCMTIVLGPPATFAIYDQNNRVFAEGEVPSPRHVAQLQETICRQLAVGIEQSRRTVCRNCQFELLSQYRNGLGNLVSPVNRRHPHFSGSLCSFTPRRYCCDQETVVAVGVAQCLVLLIQSPIPSLLYLFLAVVLIIISCGTVVILLIGTHIDHESDWLPDCLCDRLKVLVDEPGVALRPKSRNCRSQSSEPFAQAARASGSKSPPA